MSALRINGVTAGVVKVEDVVKVIAVEEEEDDDDDDDEAVVVVEEDDDEEEEEEEEEEAGFPMSSKIASRNSAGET